MKIQEDWTGLKLILKNLMDTLLITTSGPPLV